MNFIQKIKTEYGKYVLRNDLKNIRRKAVAMGYHDAIKIGLLYDASEKENYDAVKNFVRRIRNEQKDVKSLGFINSKKLPSDQFIKLGMDFFTLSQLNWHYKPISKITDSFIKEEFDILISLNVEELLPIEFIAGLSMAKFKIGKFSDRNLAFNDFMINLKPGENVSAFIQQVDHYLKELNKQ